ncbi:hypothetical protein [Paraburkholderia sp. BL10I2N1]|uniref:hypothetical protein n=1 Tax=Paraburkholderia sp. BL10I2N1 TaxID=1938796 RepID=UPI0010613F5F|nr:hypothetical protein [Paraburkholderia sp. BL10I2N1]TDN62958.1 hypothetical protein B0G77_6554 [Paraburkholderia sp. BL10I2N1]
MTGYAISSTLTALLVATATVALTACGPDDTAAGNNAAQTSSIPVSQAVSPSGAPALTNSLAASTAAPSAAPADPATAADAASGGAVTGVQASLAADSRQIAPVMHYAPGENSN